MPGLSGRPCAPEWVDWFNNQNLHTAIGYIPPHEHETNHNAQTQLQPAADVDA